MEKQYSVVKLLKNHLYPTYQLYCEMSNHRLTAEEGLKYGALTVLSWVRARLGGEYPWQLVLPEAEDFAKVQTGDLVSFHMNCGFVLDIISLPESGLWTLQITEPDLGPNPGTDNQSRPPVAGRIIETNVGFSVDNGRLLLGVQTVISDPEGAPLAEVYRPAFVRRLYLDENFGLQQIIPIVPKPYYLNTQEQLANFLQLAKNTGHQLPSILFVERRQVVVQKQATYLTLADVSRDPKGKFTGTYDHSFEGQIPDAPPTGPVAKIILGNTTPDLSRVQVDYLPPDYDVERLASSLAAYARVYVVNHSLLDGLAGALHEELECGSIILTEPQCFGGFTKVYCPGELDGLHIRAMLQNYIRGKALDFPNLHFVNSARDALERRATELELASAAQDRKRDVELAMAEKHWQAKLDEKNRALTVWEKQVEKLQCQLTAATANAQTIQEKLQQQAGKFQKQLADKDEYITYLKGRLMRPHAKKEVAQWAADNFSGRLYLHPRSVQLLEAADVNTERMELIYDALEFLATDYWENRYAGLTDEELNNRMALKYGRRFLITALRDNSIEAFEEQYKVPYAMGSHKPANQKLDYHLKIGNKAEHLVRIYFFHDEGKKLIVVGSMPDHLECVKMG